MNCQAACLYAFEDNRIRGLEESRWSQVLLERDRFLRLIGFQEPEHTVNRTDADHRLAAPSVPLVVPAIAPIPAQPSKCSFHDPAAMQQHEPLGPGRAAHHLDL